MIGTTRGDGVVDVAMLEFAIREDLNENAPRAMCVLNPLKLELTDYPEDKVEHLTVANHPSRAELGDREVTFYPRDLHRRCGFPGGGQQEVQAPGAGEASRLRNAYVIEADEVVKDEPGNIVW